MLAQHSGKLLAAVDVFLRRPASTDIGVDVPRNPPPVYGGDGAVFVPELTPERFEKAMKTEAAKALSALEAQARAAGVRCSTEAPADNQPWQGILRVARARKCDAIVMASHGRGGLGGLILGSEATRVLAHSKIPVLVVR